MKHFLLLSCLLLASARAWGQGLPEARQSSPLAYVFQLTTAEAERLAKVEGLYSFEESMLHTKVDSFPADSVYRGVPNLPYGQFLIARTEQGNLSLEWLEKPYSQVAVQNNEADLNILVANVLGKPLPQAEVHLRKRRIRYDPATGYFRIPHSKREGLLRIEADGHTDFVWLENRSTRTITFRRVINRVFFGFPLGYVTVPVRRASRDIYHSIKWGYPQGMVDRVFGIFSGDYYDDYQFEKRFHGYVVTDKPLYRTGDTVRVAAWLVKGKHERPYRKPLALVASPRGRGEEVILDTLKPIRPGSYVAEWVLADSLGLRLDTDYDLELRRKGREVKYVSIRHADYYLPKMSFEVSLDKEEHAQGEPTPVLTMKAQDTNEQLSPDGQVELWVFPKNPDDFEQIADFVPDTLWHHTQALDPKKPTELTLPDSIFRSYTFDYQVFCAFTNTENERLVATEEGRYIRAVDPIVFTFEKDSLLVDFSPLWKGDRGDVELYLGYQSGEEEVVKSALPYKLPVSLYLMDVTMEIGGIRQIWNVPEASVELIANRTDRELTLMANNPHRIPFRYYLYRGNREIERGQATDWSKTLKTSVKGRYFGSIQYVWRGDEVTKNLRFPYQSNNLQIEWEAPAAIEPGETLSLTASVKDYRGQPVPNATVQLWANNKQFESANLPDFQAKFLQQKQRKQTASFELKENRDYSKMSVKLKAEWLKLFQIDTAEFYHFLYPDSGFYQTQVPQASVLGELSPYVVREGRLEKVHIIWANEQLIYFSDATDARYAFPLPAGQYDLRLRTAKEEIRVFGVEVNHYHRTILSVDADHLPKGALRYLRTPGLTPEEREELSGSLIFVANTFPSRTAYIRQNAKIYPFFNNEIRRSQQPMWRVGPLRVDSASFKLVDGFQTDFVAEPDYLYEFRPNLLKMRREKVFEVAPESHQLMGEGAFRLREQAITPQEVAEWGKKPKADTVMPAFYLFGEWPVNPEQEGKVRWWLNDVPEFWKQDRWVLMELDSGWVNSFRALPGRLPVGRYAVFAVAENGKWVPLDTATVRPNGLNIRKFQVDSLRVSGRPTPPISLDAYKRLIYRDTIMAEGAFEGEVRGTVWNHWGIPLAGANVRDESGKLLTISALDGSFRVKTLPATRLRFETPYFEPLEATARLGAVWQVVFGRYRQTQNGMLLEEINVMDSFVVVKKELVYSVVNIQTEGRQGVADQVAQAGNVLVKGRIMDGSDGLGLPGANVFVKGTAYGTVTDLEGNYQLWAPLGSTLVVGFIGYMTELVPVTGSWSEVVLEPDVNRLEEVVVTGYGVQGRVGGVRVTYGESAPTIRIRGVSSISEANMPLLIVDGVPYTGRFEDLNLSEIASMEVLKGEAATALYGARAANGVTIITTQNAVGNVEGNPEVPPQMAVRQSGSLRTRFSDVAFWAPQLRTDREGKAQVRVTFPDNLNGWRLMAVASKGEQAATSAQNLFARKQLAATLSIPRFLVQGDTAHAIGRALNYSPDSILVATQFRGAGERPVRLGSSFTETFPLVAADTGKLTLAYTLARDNGYFDGEEQSLQVLPKGLESFEGWFAQFTRDTVVELSVPVGGKPLQVGLQSTPLQVLLDEIDHLKNYRYACNEQLASKLLAYLYDQRIRQGMGQPFGGEKQVKALIAQLEQGRLRGGGWGWWAGNPFHPFITAHVLKALALAKKMGYPIFDLQADQSKILLHFVQYFAYEKTAILKSLMALDTAKTYWKGHVLELANDTTHTLLSWVEMQQLRRQVGLSVQTDTLRKLAKTGIFGEMYWEEPKARRFSWTFNRGRTTLQVYELVRQDSAWQAELPRIWQYFVGERGGGYWRNTFESSEILGTFLPDFLQNQAYEAASVRVSGAHDRELGNRPERFTLSEGQSVKIAKKGTGYLYLSAVSARFEADPPTRSGDFRIRTRWAGQADSTRLKAAEPVTLEVEVEAVSSSEYVMIEIPIPAGCLYEKDSRTSGPYMAHSEAYRDRTVIYCQRLPAGTHTYSIELIPTFTGAYTLNPAQIRLMYFPTFQANNQTQRVGIE